MTERPAVFLDRDGTLTASLDPVRRFDPDLVYPFVPRALAELADLGYALAIVTNQGAVARGLLTWDEAARSTAGLVDHLRQLGVPVEGWALCPHHPDVTTGLYAGPCTCRKPAPGMLLALAHRHRLQLTGSWMVGDNVTDVLAGQAAGCRSALVLTGLGPRHRTAVPESVPVLPSLAALPSWIRRHVEPSSSS